MPLGFITKVIDGAIKDLVLRAWSRQRIDMGEAIAVHFPREDFEITVHADRISLSSPAWIVMAKNGFLFRLPVPCVHWQRVPIEVDGVTIDWPGVAPCVLAIRDRTISITPAITVHGTVGPLDITTTVSELRRTPIGKGIDAIDVDLNRSPIDLRLI